MDTVYSFNHRRITVYYVFHTYLSLWILVCVYLDTFYTFEIFEYSLVIMTCIVDMDYELGYSSLNIFYVILKHKLQIHRSLTCIVYRMWSELRLK